MRLAKPERSHECALSYMDVVGVIAYWFGCTDQIFLVRCGLSSTSANMGDKTEVAAEEAFKRYTSSRIARKGKGVAIVWFRNDLRLLDNEALYKAWVTSEALLPVFCFDPRHFGTTRYFGFPKTGGMTFSFFDLFSTAICVLHQHTFGLSSVS